MHHGHAPEARVGGPCEIAPVEAVDDRDRLPRALRAEDGADLKARSKAQAAMPADEGDAALPGALAVAEADNGSPDPQPRLRGPADLRRLTVDVQAPQLVSVGKPLAD